MKVSSFYFSPVVVSMLAIVLTVPLPRENVLSFSIEMGGLDKNVLKTGVTPRELGMVTIQANNKEVTVEEFSVILAKGSRPQAKKTVKGNNFDLSVFSEQLRSGDRILIQVEQTSAGVVGKAIPHVNLLIIPIK